jgi:type VI secretion system Hcp family effector
VSRVFALRSSSGGEGEITVVKQIDRASPGLHQAICAAPGFSEVEIELCEPDSNGVEHTYLTLTLMNPLIVGHAFIGSATDGTFQVPLEEVTFAYDEAVWVYADTAESTTVNPCSIP